MQCVIFLFRNNQDFNRTIHICKTRNYEHDPRSFLELIPCKPADGWSTDFQLVGGSSKTKNAIKLFALKPQNIVTSRLSLFKLDGFRIRNEVYIPGTNNSRNNIAKKNIAYGLVLQEEEQGRMLFECLICGHKCYIMFQLSLILFSIIFEFISSKFFSFSKTIFLGPKNLKM